LNIKVTIDPAADPGTPREYVLRLLAAMAGGEETYNREANLTVPSDGYITEMLFEALNMAWGLTAVVEIYDADVDMQQLLRTVESFMDQKD